MNHPAGAASVAQTLSPPMRDFIARSRSQLTLEVPAHLNAPATIEELAALQGDHRMALDMAGVPADAARGGAVDAFGADRFSRRPD